MIEPGAYIPIAVFLFVCNIGNFAYQEYGTNKQAKEVLLFLIALADFLFIARIFFAMIRGFT